MRTGDRRPKTTDRTAFTLIELLTVIAIIAILAALLFPAVRTALQKAEIAQAKTDIKALETAIKAYYTEYGKLPCPDADQGVCDKYYFDSGSADKQRDIMDILRANDPGAGPNAGNVLNPKKIPFFEPPSRKGAIGSSTDRTFYDPWGKPYFIKLDNNYNNLIEYFTGGGCGPNEKIAGIAIVGSYGPNGSQQDPAATGSDDIVNYR